VKTSGFKYFLHGYIHPSAHLHLCNPIWILFTLWWMFIMYVSAQIFQLFFFGFVHHLQSATRSLLWCSMWRPKELHIWDWKPAALTAMLQRVFHSMLITAGSGFLYMNASESELHQFWLPQRTSKTQRFSQPNW